jgi:hypothetical protein
MTEDEEAAEIVRRLSMTPNERMYDDLRKSIESLSSLFKTQYYARQTSLQKEDGDKERTD